MEPRPFRRGNPISEFVLLIANNASMQIRLRVPVRRRCEGPAGHAQTGDTPGVKVTYGPAIMVVTDGIPFAQSVV